MTSGAHNAMASVILCFIRRYTTYMAGGEKPRHIVIPSSYTLWMGHLAVRCHITSPIVMGHIPPLGFDTATAVRVRYCNQSSSRQDRRHCQTNLALRKQVHQPDKVLDQGLGDTRRPCFTKVLNPEARGAGCCVDRETPQ